MWGRLTSPGRSFCLKPGLSGEMALLALPRSVLHSYSLQISNFKMTHIQLNPLLLGSLSDKVVVLTGGATGIGRATVKQLCGE